MKIKKILLTGDDGYKSPGIRLLVAALKDKYDLTIAATVTQQSAVGGLISLADGFDWGIDQVDGIKAFWVKGSPVDAMSLISQYYDENEFDLIISGVNWGGNIGSSIFGSGTVNAALRGLVLEIAPHAIAMSWDLPSKFYLNHHNGVEDLSNFIDYPGKTIDKVLDVILENKLWGSKLVNVNFPQEKAKEILFTKTINQIKKVYSNNPKASERLKKMKSGHFSYHEFLFERNYDLVGSLDYDISAVNKGYISITPLSNNLVDEKIFAKLQGKKLGLD